MRLAIAPLSLLLLVVFADPATRPALAGTPGPVARLELDGLVAYQQTLDDQPLELRVYLRAGRDVVGEAAGGLADVMASWMVLGGTRSLPGEQFAAARRALRLELDAWADRDLVVIEARAPRDQFRPALRLIGDLVIYPSFAPTVAARAREAAARATEPLDPTMALLRTAQELDDRARPANAAPTQASRDDVVRFHRDHVGVDTTFVIVTGPLTATEVERELRTAFLGFPRAAAPARIEPGNAEHAWGATIAQRETRPGQTGLIVARRTLHRSHPEWLALEVGVMAGMIAIQSDHRIRPASTRLRIEQPLLGPDAIVLELSLDSRRVDAYKALLDTVLERLVSRGPGKKAFEAARTQLAEALFPPDDSKNSARAHGLIEALGLEGRSPDEHRQRLRTLDLGQVRKALREYL